jgi:hypothetical protein
LFPRVEIGAGRDGILRREFMDLGEAAEVGMRKRVRLRANTPISTPMPWTT